MASSAGPAPHTLPGLLKRRLIHDMVRAVDPPGKWKIMVVDATSLKILSAVLRIFDVLEENVTLLENLARNRQAYQNLEAIYFLAPTDESVDLFIKDFSGRHLYAGGHLFFAGALSDRLFNKLKSSPASRFIRTCKELFVDFLVFDARSFHLDSPRTFHTIYSPTTPPTAQVAELQGLAKRISSVMATLGEYPNVRWWDGSKCEVQGRGVGRVLADMVQAELDDLCRLDSDFPPQSPFPRATLIIVDRTIDTVAPLLHEFTYQAMINDLLPIEEGTKYNYTTAEGQNVSVSLDDSDPLWKTIRHSHIAETINITIERFNAFMSGNAAAKSALGAAGQGSAASLKDMKATLAALPQFQELKTKFAAHINLCQECMGLFERGKLASVGGVEQDMATGKTVEGDAPKNVVVNMVPLLDDPSISTTDKLRLLLLYIIARDGISDEERRKLIQQARLAPDETDAFANLAFLGCHLKPSATSRSVPGVRPSYVGSSVRDKGSKKKGAADDEERPYDLSRFVPTLKYVMEDQCRNTLDLDLFPHTKELPPDDAGAPTVAKGLGISFGGRQVPVASADPDRGKVVSLRTTKPTWAKKTPELLAQMQAQAAETDPIKRAAQGEVDEDLRRNGGRVIVFVLGGMTYSELRSAYEVAKKERREIIVGTDYFLTPAEYVRNLRELKKPVLAPRAIFGNGSSLESAITSPSPAVTGSVYSPTPTSPSISVGMDAMNLGAPGPLPRASSLTGPAARPSPPPIFPAATNRQGTMDDLTGSKKKGLFGKLKFGK